MTITGSSGNPLIVGLPALRSAVDAAADHTVHPVTGEPIKLSGKERAELFKLTMAPTANIQWMRTKIVDRMISKGQLPPEAAEMVRSGASIEDLGMISLRHNLARILEVQAPSVTAHAGGVGGLGDALDGTDGTLGMHRLGPDPSVHTMYAPDDTPLSRFVSSRVADAQGVPYGGVRGQSTATTLGLADDVAAGIDPAVQASLDDAREALHFGIARISEADAGGMTPAQRMDVLHGTAARLSSTGEASTVESMLIRDIVEHPDPRISASVFEEELIRVATASVPDDVPGPVQSRTLPVDMPEPVIHTPKARKPLVHAPPVHTPPVGAVDDVAKAAASAVESARVAAEAAGIARKAATDAVITSDALMHMDDEFRLAAPALSAIAARGALASASQTEKTFAMLAKALQRL